MSNVLQFGRLRTALYRFVNFLSVTGVFYGLFFPVLSVLGVSLACYVFCCNGLCEWAFAKRYDLFADLAFERTFRHGVSRINHVWAFFFWGGDT